MNGPRRLDDSLARMAKWEKLRRGTEAAAGRADGAAQAEGPGDPAGRSVPLPAIDDLIQTIRELAVRQPSLSVAVIAQEAGVTWRVHTVRVDGEVQVVAARADARPGLEQQAHPALPPTPELPPTPAPAAAPDAGSATAARLAEMLRTNPRLLDG